jgi:adenylate cyclase
MSAIGSAEIFEFADFRLHQDLSLWRLEHGKPLAVSLPRRAREVLSVLLEAYPAAIERRTLFEKFWRPGANDNNLDMQLKTLRRKIDPTGSIIKTVYAEGFRIGVPVQKIRKTLTPSADVGTPIEALRPVSDFDERPAIAVLPFANVSGDPNQDYFADGITYNIISELASWRAFPVIGRGSTFAFKNRDIDTQSLGEQLGARYLVDGSAAKTTTRVQVTAQLIDATNGQCLVPERHERDVGDLFEIQREIVEVIVGSIAPEVLKVECERVERRQSLNPTSYEYFMRGLAFHYRYTKEDNAEAQRLFRQAIDADSKNAQAYARLAHAMVYAVQHRWREDADHNFEIADKLATHALALDSRAPSAHFALGSTSMFLGRTEQALAEMQEAVQVNPSHAAAHAVMAHLLCYMGRPAEGLQSIERALRLSPHDPRLGIWLPALAQAYYFLERYEAAIAAARRALSLTPGNVIATRFLAAALGQLERVDEAAPAVAFLRVSREPTLVEQKRLMDPLYRAPEKVSHVLAGLQKAGLI